MVTWHTTTLYDDASLRVKRITEILLGCISHPFHFLDILWKDCNIENKAAAAASYSFNYLYYTTFAFVSFLLWLSAGRVATSQ